MTTIETCLYGDNCEGDNCPNHNKHGSPVITRLFFIDGKYFVISEPNKTCIHSHCLYKKKSSSICPGCIMCTIHCSNYIKYSIYHTKTIQY